MPPDSVTQQKEMLSNPFWHALNTEHASLAIGSGLARRYPADVIPVAGLAESTPEAMTALASLLAPSEKIYVTGDDLPAVEELEEVNVIPCWQYHFPSGAGSTPEAEGSVQVRTLSAADAPAMVALTDVAFPGFFRARTYLLGSYFGIHIDGELVAMAGERAALPGYRELSAICTHPAHTGQGYAALLSRHILRSHALAGLHSFLHVAAANHRAIALYERLGFLRTIPMQFQQLRRFGVFAEPMLI